ncbi:MAG: YdeI/OmpD-associated family protein [Bacteroidota bacterium]|nr:YdeI/OmpD-associated family protein [Bacteroidota bacterium]
MPIKNKDIAKNNGLIKSGKVDLEIISFVSQKEFEKWQEHNHHIITGIWIRFYKKNSGITSITYDEALDVALCYGWIDGQLKKYDELSYLQKFTPRRPRSMWSKRNKDHVIRLEKEGKMKPSGINEVENARRDGRWDKAYDSPGKMEVPEDFIRELSKNRKAFGFFESLDKTNRYSIGWRLQTAKNAEIREKRMKEIINMMEKEEKFH